MFLVKPSLWIVPFTVISIWTVNSLSLQDIAESAGVSHPTCTDAPLCSAPRSQSTSDCRLELLQKTVNVHVWSLCILISAVTVHICSDNCLRLIACFKVPNLQNTFILLFAYDWHRNLLYETQLQPCAKQKRERSHTVRWQFQMFHHEHSRENKAYNWALFIFKP